MKFWLSALFAALLFTLSTDAQPCPRIGWTSGIWSTLAAQPCRENRDQKPVTILSPNRKRLLLIKTDNVFEGTVGGTSTEKWLVYHPGDEYIWSPNSDEVLTSFCFGAMGPCGVASTEDDETRPTITDVVRKAFASERPGDTCYAEANVGALTWEPDPDRIVVIGEVPNSPQCRGDDEGYFESFVISLSTRKIVSRFNMQETIRRWHGILGLELRNAIKVVRDDAKDTGKQQPRNPLPTPNR